MDAQEFRNNLTEKGAEAIWREVAAFPSWQTWERRIEAERVHKGDPSWGRMTDRCREYAAAVVDAILPAIAEAWGEGEATGRSAGYEDAREYHAFSYGCGPDAGDCDCVVVNPYRALIQQQGEADADRR